MWHPLGYSLHLSTPISISLLTLSWTAWHLAHSRCTIAAWLANYRREIKQLLPALHVSALPFLLFSYPGEKLFLCEDKIKHLSHTLTTSSDVMHTQQHLKESMSLYYGHRGKSWCSENLSVQVSILVYVLSLQELNGNPLQYPCLENPMGGGAW